MTGIPQNSGWSWHPIEGSTHSPILVIGLGNPILGDDGVGWRVAEGVRERLGATTDPNLAGLQEPGGSIQPAVEIDCLAVGGLALMERLVGYRRAIIIDAITTDQVPPGTVACLQLSELPERTMGHLSSAHDTTLQNALRVAEMMGVGTPDEIRVIGIETNQIFDFSEELTQPTLNAIPQAIDYVMELLK
jgi:hydrogenase maturation protease